MAYPLLRICLLLLSLVWAGQGIAQTRYLTGKVVDEKGQPLAGATVKEGGAPGGDLTDGQGQYVLRLSPKAGGSVEINVRHLGYAPRALRVAISRRDTTRVADIALAQEAKALDEVNVVGQNERSALLSTVTINPRLSNVLPTPFGDFNKLLATLPGVVTTSELTSQYSVRGGNYDENLVYVNDQEVYRPTIVRAGQQEGLSFVNPDLVQRADFSSGGWAPRYGDKLSSVLAVRYKQPRRNAGSVSAGLLTQTAHIELGSVNSRWSLVAGVRRKSAEYLLRRTFLTRGFDVQGQYLPRFFDGQALLTYRVSDLDTTKFLSDVKVQLLTTGAANRYKVIPEEQQTQFGTIQGVLRLNVAFEGQELLTYNTFQNGLSVSARLGRVRTELIAQHITSFERERNNVEGGYRLCDVGQDPGRDNFNRCVTLRGVGTFFNYARNRLDVEIQGLQTRNYWSPTRNLDFEAGVGIQQERIADRLDEYTFADSADYVTSTPPLDARASLASWRTQGYVQATWRKGPYTVVGGVRAQYWTLNGQALAAPRLQVLRKMDSAGRWLLKAAAGVYQQPAFYRELRDYDGSLYTNLRAQQSYHFVVASDVALTMWGRPFRFISEGYFKNVPRIIPYDVDNVRIRYRPTLGGRAYAAGLDFRLAGEFIKGTESWFSLGILQTKENIDGDSTGFTPETRAPRAFIRRPTDQRVTAAVFFQDYLPNNPSWRVYLNAIVGTGLPFGPPNNLDNRAAISAPWYRRIDIGFSKIIALQDRNSRLGRRFETAAIGLDILNLVGINNTISYLWIRDVNNTQFAIPNYLSARFFNLKMRVDF